MTALLHAGVDFICWGLWLGLGATALAFALSNEEGDKR